MKTKKTLISLIFITAFFYGLVILCFIHKPSDYSVSEKRKLAQFPKVTVESIWNGKFMEGFGSYTQDQFPGRELFRRAAAFFSCKVLKKADNHDIYVVVGSAAKLDYTYSEDSIKHATERFKMVYDSYLKDACNNVYVSVVPDKGYLLAPLKKYPAMDYDSLVSDLTAGMDYAKYIDIFDTVNIEDYYFGDPHWRSEKLKRTADRLAGGLGVSLKEAYDVKTLPNVYKGTYAGQSALNIRDEYISYISNPAIDEALVNNLESNKTCGVYDFEKGEGRDPYEFFLSGPVSLLEIHNNKAPEEKRLIMFRDSFGSSIAPWLIEAYSEIVLVDIRYLAPEYLGKFVDFKDADVLFIYSTSVLNHSETIK